ncbi:MAG: protease family protein [Actinomycetota bacterium]|nr:protease family protein [Actinomycetota bacterium]MEA2842766.1 protease family protein [Actinomycetota bacterium]
MDPQTPADQTPPERPVGIPVQPRWGLGDAVAGFVLAIVLATVVGNLWLAAFGGSEDGLGARTAGQVGLWAGLVGMAVLASRRKGYGTLATDFGFTARWSDLGVGVATAVGASFVVVPVVALALRPIFGHPDVSKPVHDLVEQASGPKALVLVLVAVVFAPLVEELFFRGLLLRSLQRRVGTGWAVALSSVFFGLAHPQPLKAGATVIVMAGLTSLAVILALLAVRTGRLGASIVAHAGFNAISLLFAYR